MSPSLAQNTSYRFDNLTEKQGMPDANIASIVKDNLGYMWFASSEGLSRFDGTYSRVYRHSNVDSNSISTNNINAIFEDSKQRLWIGTRNGLNLYDRLNDNFIHFYHDSTNKNSISSNEVWALSEDKKGNLWIGTMGGGLNKLIESKVRNTPVNSWRFIHFSFNPGDSSSLSDNSVWSIAFDNFGQGWIGTYNGLNSFSVKDETGNHISFKRYLNTPDKNSISYNSVWRVMVDDNNNLVWLLSYGKMLDCMRTDRLAKAVTPSFIHVVQALEKKVNIRDLIALSIVQDRPNSYWIGTDGHGLIHCVINVNNKSGEIIVSEAEQFMHNEEDAQSLINNSIYELFRDEAGLIWIGTENGISRYTPQKNLLDAAHLNSSELINMPVKVSYSDNQYTWFANGNKIWIYKPGTFLYPVCMLDNPEITCLYRTFSGDLLIGTSPNGIFYLPQKEIQTFVEQKSRRLILPKQFNFDIKPNSNNLSIYLFNGKHNQVIIGGYGIIGLLNTDTHTFEKFHSRHPTKDPAIFRCIAETGESYYIGTDNGLFIFDKNKSGFEPFQPLNDKPGTGRINSLLLKDSILWIASVSGLHKYDIRKKLLRSYFREDGLPDNNIVSLSNDNAGNIWIATRNGLSRAHPGNFTFGSYYENEGLNNNQLNGLSFDGQFLFISTEKGINTIIPSLLKNSIQKRIIVISDFRIAGKSVFAYPVSEKEKMLKLNRPIKINWTENNIAIQFNTPEYINPGAVKYAFKLERFDKSWTYNENKTTANYTNIPGGNYIFRIKYAGTDGQWYEADTTIFINVSTAWFRAWWFYAICCAVIIGLCYSYYHMQLSRILDMQRVRNKIARDLHDDIGSTLSTIKILSGAAEKKVASDALQSGKMLRKITESADKMMDAMNDIVWSINPNNDSLDNMAVRMREYAAKALEPNDIAYKVLTNEGNMNIKLTIEKRKDIFLIFKEAVNNLAKYAKATEAIISLTVHENLIELIIKDNGIGFNTSSIYSGNGLKNMQQRASNLGGKCTVNSNLKEGTTIRVILSIT